MIAPSVSLDKEYSEDYLIAEKYFTAPLKLVKETAKLTDVEIFVCDAESGRPIPRAMISLDTISLTDVCDKEGKVLLKDLLTGSYPIDIIVPGYIAFSTVLNLDNYNSNRLNVKMISNS